MAVHAELSDVERFLLTVPNDTEDAPWMVMSGLQSRDTVLLIEILRLHVQRNRLSWYLEAFLKVTMPRPAESGPLEAAPDILMVEAEDRLRTSWSIPAEGKPPQFVLEVTVDSSWDRDTGHKPQIYDAMGVREFALFAPERRDGGPPLFGYHRDEAGRWVEWEADAAGILWSRELGNLGLYVEGGLWLRAVTPKGERLPTPTELARTEAAARATEELRRQAAERERDAEAYRRAEAEAEADRLREELRRLRGEDV